MSGRGVRALDALVSLRRADVALRASTAADYCDRLDDLRAAEIAAYAVADAEIADRSRPPATDRAPAVIRAEIARLEAENSVATQWGAAVAARHEWISALRGELRRAARAAAAEDDGA